MKTTEIIMKRGLNCTDRMDFKTQLTSMELNTTIMKLGTTQKVNWTKIIMFTEKGIMRNIGTQKQTMSIIASLWKQEPG